MSGFGGSGAPGTAVPMPEAADARGGQDSVSVRIELSRQQA